MAQLSGSNFPFESRFERNQTTPFMFSSFLLLLTTPLSLCGLSGCVFMKVSGTNDPHKYAISFYHFLSCLWYCNPFILGPEMYANYIFRRKHQGHQKERLGNQRKSYVLLSLLVQVGFQPGESLSQGWQMESIHTSIHKTCKSMHFSCKSGIIMSNSVDIGPALLLSPQVYTF